MAPLPTGTGLRSRSGFPNPREPLRCLTAFQLNPTQEALSGPCWHEEETWMPLMGKHWRDSGRGQPRLPQQSGWLVISCRILLHARPSQSWARPRCSAGPSCFAHRPSLQPAGRAGPAGASLQDFPPGSASLPCANSQLHCAAWKMFTDGPARAGRVGRRRRHTHPLSAG